MTIKSCDEIRFSGDNLGCPGHMEATYFVRSLISGPIVCTDDPNLTLFQRYVFAVTLHQAARDSDLQTNLSGLTLSCCNNASLFILINQSVNDTEAHP